MRLKLSHIESRYLTKELSKKKRGIVLNIALFLFVTCAISFALINGRNTPEGEILAIAGLVVLVTLLGITWYIGYDLFTEEIENFEVIDSKGKISHECQFNEKNSYRYYYNGNRLRVPKNWEHSLHTLHATKKTRQFRIAKSTCRAQDHYLLKVYDSEWTIETEELT